MSYTYEYKWKLKDGLKGMSRPNKPMSKTEIIQSLENECGVGCVAEIDGVDVTSLSESSINHDNKMSVNAIQTSWAKAFESVRNEL